MPYYNSTNLGNDNFAIKVQYNDETHNVTPLKATSMLLHKLKTTTEKELGNKVTDVVISVPSYYNEFQRRELIDAATISGLNCLSIINEITAVALLNGFYKIDLHEENPIHSLYIDCGHSATTAAVVAFTKGKMRVISSVCNPNVGGRDIDTILTNHFEKEFASRYRLDIRGNGRAMIRLEAASERLKKILSSGVPEAAITIESFLNDVDVKGKMVRSDFETLIQPIVDSICNVVKQALEQSGISADKFANVEIVGGNKRVPLIQKHLTQLLGRDLGQTMIDSEAVARGCALQCALLSPLLRVKKFIVQDIVPRTIQVHWNYTSEDSMQIESEENSIDMFLENSNYPATKSITFAKCLPFEINAYYKNENGSKSFISKFAVNNIPKSQNSTNIKVRVRLNQNGCINIEGAEMLETVEVEEPVPVVTPPPSTTTTSTPSTPSTSNDNNQTTSSEIPSTTTTENNNNNNNNENTETKPQTIKRKRTHYVDLKIQNQTHSLESTILSSLIEEESKMLAQDKLIVETAEARNALESYVLDMRSRVNSGDLLDFINSNDRELFNQKLDAMENWIYEDGYDETKGVYVAKLNELQKLGNPVVIRKRELEERTFQISQLTNSVETLIKSLSDSKYEHIENSEKQKIIDESNKLIQSQIQRVQEQNQKPKSVDPSFPSSDIVTKKIEFEKFANGILSKPKPTPPPAPTSTPTPTPAPAPETENNNTNNNNNTQNNEKKSNDVEMTD
eukprot:TRINITY_DN257_c0_g1_i3.p1 TRINITY_DN257_c0_g1~~TRINITY_DN257_c0_g1_i3.p1  ORF type:complete len:827 (-),score=489.54 TRINITY_DN257_c0_g1_i3:181-2394(-)